LLYKDEKDIDSKKKVIKGTTNHKKKVINRRKIRVKSRQEHTTLNYSTLSITS